MTETIQVVVPDDMQAAIKHAVSDGSYASEADVVRDALQSWRQQRDTKSLNTDHLRRLWDEGVASGPAAPLDMQLIKRKARSRLENKTGS